MRSFLDHLECTRCAGMTVPDRIQGVCECGGPLLARYHLGPDTGLLKDQLRERPPTLWRYAELLPVRGEANVITLGEGFTPLLQAVAIGQMLGIPHLWVKDEGLQPTGSFKARGAAVALSRAKELGVTTVGVSTAGNLGEAWAVYGARAGMRVHVVLPRDSLAIVKVMARAAGADVHLVDGGTPAAAEWMRKRITAKGWYDANTFREPYRVEGKKTIGFEIAEQLGWELPDAILFPTGGGVGIVAMWKAFAELQQLGWIDAKRPKMYSVQASGCAPIVKAFTEGRHETEPWGDVRVITGGLRNPKPVGDFLVLRILRESSGGAVAVTDDQILEAMKDVAIHEGMVLSPEGAATIAALRGLAQAERIALGSRVVVVNTASGLKYPHLLRQLSRQSVRRKPRTLGTVA